MLSRRMYMYAWLAVTHVHYIETVKHFFQCLIAHHFSFHTSSIIAKFWCSHSTGGVQYKWLFKNDRIMAFVVHGYSRSFACDLTVVIIVTWVSLYAISDILCWNVKKITNSIYWINALASLEVILWELSCEIWSHKTTVPMLPEVTKSIILFCFGIIISRLAGNEYTIREAS